MALSLSGSPSSSGHRSGPSRRASRSPGFPRTPSWPFMSLLSPSALTAGPILLRVPGNLTGITAPAAGPQVALRSVTFPPARPQSGHFHSCCTRTSPCHVRDARATSLHACSLFPRCSRRAPTTRNSLPSGPQRRGLSWLSRRPACGRGHWSDLSETASRAKARVLQGPLPAPPPSTRGAAWCQRVLGHLRDLNSKCLTNQNQEILWTQSNGREFSADAISATQGFQPPPAPYPPSVPR
ncbi:uncharacterized protein LOC123644943 isoform X2 [Lemur catta]|uniref:uncharacterized protein LOC123644943 isoform X2 n=1 Tax=Lemur catta TaxID=9447 RepID=UPI001E268F4B|nr:uncharacterized protein LOC123644943 isoform X2 [Lemur catta]